MTAFETYLTLIKGYCGATLLFVSRAFANGGWLWSTFSMVASGIFTTLCASKLIQIGQKYQVFSYSSIV